MILAEDSTLPLTPKDDAYLKRCVLMLLIMVPLTTITTSKLDTRLVRAVKEHLESKTHFPGALVGLVGLPLITDAAGLWTGLIRNSLS